MDNKCAECAEDTNAVELREFKAVDGRYMFGSEMRSAPSGKVVLCRECVDVNTGFVWREGRSGSTQAASE